MVRLFKAFLFKISKDLTFRITLIIGAGLAVLMTGLYAALQYGLFALDGMDSETDIGIKFISGQGMLINSMSPAQNYGLAIPINLITFICLEFSQGTIRNKIIAGHSKFKIYVSLFIGGLIFAFALLGTYLLICTGLGTIFGGFNLEESVYLLTGIAQVTPEYLVKMIIICIVTYVSIVSFAIFVSTAFRSVGPSIPLVLVPIMICYFAAMISSLLSMMEGSGIEGFINVIRIVDPLYAIGAIETKTVVVSETDYNIVAYLSNETFISGICNNLVYAAIFFTAGSILFKKRDVK